LITTNCAVLGVAVLNSDMFFVNGKPIPGSFIYSIFQGLCVGVGYTLAMLLMSGIRERLELCDSPKSLQGLPLSFIVAALMSLAFMGFNGFKF
jgi:Na+-translocating ferredoxin:NAD+ oxidoreductase subunit A